MTYKAYIVVNKQQELEVLKKFEQGGLKWASGRKPTEFFPSNTHPFPILLCERDWITWDYLDNLKNEEIVYDGRKEEKMYKVTQEFMEELNKWRYEHALQFDIVYLNKYALDALPKIVKDWRESGGNVVEDNKRLMAIFNWTAGENVFEIGTPKYIVQRKDPVSRYGREYLYVSIDKHLKFVYEQPHATRFDDYMEAREWAGIHFEVVEVDE